MTSKKRIILLDELRGLAIVAMIIHHFFLDVGDVLSLDWGYTIFNKLCVFQPIFWAIFIVISGVCSRLSKNTIKRGIIVLFCGVLVTFTTVIFMPKVLKIDGAQIYFGVLTCLGSCMIICGILKKIIDKSSTKWGLITSAFFFLATYNISSGTLLFGLIKLPQSLFSTDLLMPFGIYSSSFFSADYFALFPWFFLFLFGVFIGRFAADGSFPEWTYKSHFKPLQFVGKHSLYFYLAHQIVIYAILYLVLKIIVFVALHQ